MVGPKTGMVGPKKNVVGPNSRAMTSDFAWEVPSVVQPISCLKKCFSYCFVYKNIRSLFSCDYSCDYSCDLFGKTSNIFVSLFGPFDEYFGPLFGPHANYFGPLFGPHAKYFGPLFGPHDKYFGPLFGPIDKYFGPQSTKFGPHPTKQTSAVSRPIRSSPREPNGLCWPKHQLNILPKTCLQKGSIFVSYNDPVGLRLPCALGISLEPARANCKLKLHRHRAR
jgi:hypothetical protein